MKISKKNVFSFVKYDSIRVGIVLLKSVCKINYYFVVSKFTLKLELNYFKTKDKVIIVNATPISAQCHS